MDEKEPVGRMRVEDVGRGHVTGIVSGKDEPRMQVDD